MRFAVLILAVAAFAGCAAPAGDPAPRRAEAPEAVSMNFAIEGCIVVETQVPVSPELARRHTPAGFEPLVDGGTVRAILGGATCASGSRSFLALAVTPTDERLLGEGVERYFWEPEHELLEGEPLAEAFRAMRANATRADSIVAAESLAGARLDVAAGGWRHTMEQLGPGAPPATQLKGAFREYVPAEGGYAYVEGTFDIAPDGSLAAGPATFTTGEGTVAREVLGAQGAGASVALRNVAFAGGKIGFVPFEADAAGRG